MSDLFSTRLLFLAALVALAGIFLWLALGERR